MILNKVSKHLTLNFLSFHPQKLYLYWVSVAEIICCCHSVAKSCPPLCNPMNLSTPGFPITWSLFKLMFIESLMPSNHLILCCPLLLLPSIFPTSGSFPMSWLLTSGGQSIRTSAPVLPVNIRGWPPLGLTGLISLLSKRQREAWRATVHGVTESDTTEQLTHTSYIYNGVCNAVCLKLKLY